MAASDESCGSNTQKTASGDSEHIVNKQPSIAPIPVQQPAICILFFPTRSFHKLLIYQNYIHTFNLLLLTLDNSIENTKMVFKRKNALAGVKNECII